MLTVVQGVMRLVQDYAQMDLARVHPHGLVMVVAIAIQCSIWIRKLLEDAGWVRDFFLILGDLGWR